jgi:hypothetical protein
MFGRMNSDTLYLGRERRGPARRERGAVLRLEMAMGIPDGFMGTSLFL